MGGLGRAPLVTRDGRTVRLTDTGRVPAAHAERVLRAEDDALAAVRAVGTSVSGPLRIGVFGSTAGALLAPLVVALATAHPGLEVTSREVAVDDSAAAVRRGEVDVASGLDCSTAGPPDEGGEGGGGAGGGAEPLDLAVTASCSWILPPAATHCGAAMRSACRAAGFEPRVVHEVTDTAAARAVAARGPGVTPVTDLVRELVALPVRALPVRVVTEVLRAVVGTAAGRLT